MCSLKLYPNRLRTPRIDGQGRSRAKSTTRLSRGRDEVPKMGSSLNLVPPDSRILLGRFVPLNAALHVTGASSSLTDDEIVAHQ